MAAGFVWRLPPLLTGSTVRCSVPRKYSLPIAGQRRRERRGRPDTAVVGRRERAQSRGQAAKPSQCSNLVIYFFASSPPSTCSKAL